MKYVLYHANCYDGFGAAYAAWKKLGNEATYIPVSYGKPPPEMPDAEVIYILDFSYNKETILALSQNAQVVVLDHHKTAQAELEPLIRTDHNGPPEIFNPHIVFDMNKSGAYLAWEFFHNEKPSTYGLISHISDRDLWQFKLEGSRLIHKALVSYPMDFKLWDNFNIEELILEGRTCDRLYKQIVENIVKGSYLGKIDEHVVPMVNTSVAWSEVGEALYNKYSDYQFVASFTCFDDNIMFSLRSKGDFDVSEVAKKFGGGGHKNAAGFKVKSLDRIKSIQINSDYP